MNNNKPKEITLKEYKEIIELPKIRELWGIGENFSEEEFRDWLVGIYGVKFDFVSGSPGWCGEMYILQGDALTGHPPVLLIRDRKKKLEVTSYDPDFIN